MGDMRFWYPASISQITEINESFDSCLLRVCYTGKNRNKSIISREAIEKAIPTMAYCPIVANYDVESDTIGGHDVDFIEDTDGVLKMVNLTDAVGVIPDNPQWKWETITEESGAEHDYLVTPAILWKRTPVYDKLKRDGVSGQSMEIRVREGKLIDGDFEITSFDFTAFCLLGDGVEPCFESANVELFSADRLSTRLGEMMTDFKKNFTSVIAASADDINTPSGDNTFTKGGENSLDINMLLEKYGLKMEDVDFEIEGKSEQEIEDALKTLSASFADEDTSSDSDSENADGDAGESNGETDGDSGSEEGSGESSDPEEPAEDDDNDDAPGGSDKKNFQLTGEQMVHGIIESLKQVTYTDEWGTWPRYGYTDYDPQEQEVFVYDYEDWNLYGFKYEMNGDIVVIDFDSKKRKKFAYVDYDDGDATGTYMYMLDGLNAKFSAIIGEISELRNYKKSIEDSEREAQKSEVFSKFEDLIDDEGFKSLRENCSGLSIQEIEDKCYAIRGRNVQVKFSQGTPKPVRIPVERNKNKDADEPYGGVFVEFGIGH